MSTAHQPQDQTPIPEGYELAKKKKPWFKRPGCITPLAIVAIIIIAIAASSGGDSSDSPAPTDTTATAPADAPQEATDPGADSDVPTEFRNALKKGERYANSQDMSKQGVYNQLTSEFEGFTPEAAQYAIDNIEADWQANALSKGQRYYEQQAMSPDAVYNQLTSEFEGFTPEEAQYAVDNLQ